MRGGGEERFREDVIVWGDGTLGAEGTPRLRGCGIGSVPTELAEKVGEGGTLVLCRMTMRKCLW